MSCNRKVATFYSAATGKVTKVSFLKFGFVN